LFLIQVFVLVMNSRIEISFIRLIYVFTSLQSRRERLSKKLVFLMASAMMILTFACVVKLARASMSNCILPYRDEGEE
jgi:hypothetical protein